MRGPVEGWRSVRERTRTQYREVIHVQGGDIPDVIHKPPPHLERPPGRKGPRCQCRNCGAVASGEFNVPCHTRRCPKCGAPMEEVP